MAPHLIVIIFIIESSFYKSLRHLYVFKKIVMKILRDYARANFFYIRVIRVREFLRVRPLAR